MTNESFRILTANDISGLSETEKSIPYASFAVWVRALMQNWRQGTVACKGRAELVSRSNKKPWKQKGTGRARAGSPRSPLWRGGGVIFGPQARVKKLELSQSSKKNVLKYLLAERLAAETIGILDWKPNQESPKTVAAYTILRQSGFVGKKVILFVSSSDIATYTSFANIPTVRMLFFDQPNAFDLAYAEHWLVLEKDLNYFKEVVSQWI